MSCYSEVTNLFTIVREGQVPLYRNNPSDCFTIAGFDFDCTSQQHFTVILLCWKVQDSSVVELRICECKGQQKISGSIVVSIPACHHYWLAAGDRGSIPRQRGFFLAIFGPLFFFKKLYTIEMVEQ